MSAPPQSEVHLMNALVIMRRYTRLYKLAELAASRHDFSVDELFTKQTSDDVYKWKIIVVGLASVHRVANDGVLQDVFRVSAQFIMGATDIVRGSTWGTLADNLWELFQGTSLKTMEFGGRERII